MSYQEPGIPEVMILSNIVENGKPIGLADAGQDWHTDMSYSHTIAFANVLYAHQDAAAQWQVARHIPSSADMRAAYDDLPADLKQKLEGKTVLHDFNKFWEMMRREKGSKRPPLTEAQRKAKPPVSHPIFLTHPITGTQGALRQSRLLGAHQRAAREGKRRDARSSSSSTSSSPSTATATSGPRAMC